VYKDILLRPDVSGAKVIGLHAIAKDEIVGNYSGSSSNVNAEF